jgi:hypothetical protein
MRKINRPGIKGINWPATMQALMQYPTQLDKPDMSVKEMYVRREIITEFIRGGSEFFLTQENFEFLLKHVEEGKFPYSEAIIQLHTALRLATSVENLQVPANAAKKRKASPRRIVRRH